MHAQSIYIYIYIYIYRSSLLCILVHIAGHLKFPIAHDNESMTKQLEF